VPSIVVDTGPLLALFAPGDAHHSRFRAWFANKRPALRLASVPAVVAETAFLLDFSPRRQAAFLQWLAEGAIAVVDLDAQGYRSAAALLLKYQDLSMDFADACLVWLANQLGTRDVLTVDQRDFSVYRNVRGRPFRIVPA
jgi:predicted nucleic acid-binding protein